MSPQRPGCEREETNDGDLETRSNLLPITEDGDGCAARRAGLRRNPEPMEQKPDALAVLDVNPGSGHLQAERRPPGSTEHR